MTRKHEGRASLATIARPITKTFFLDARSLSRHAAPAQPKSHCARWHCPRPATTIHVATPGGAQERLCARCLRAACQRERVEIVRAQLDVLFARCRPRLLAGGGVIAALIALLSIGERRVAA